MNEYLKHFNKTIKSSPHPDADPKKLFMGIKVRQNLDTLKVWIELRDLYNQSYLPAAWTVTTLDETKERIKELSAIKKSHADDNLKDPEVLKDINSWEPFEELLMSYLRTARGACNVPLAYIVRTEATSDTADFNAVYVDEDERYIRCTKHKGSYYSADNRRVWQLLKRLTSKSNTWCFIKRYDAVDGKGGKDKEDGRAAFLKLLKQAGQDSRKDARKEKAYSDIQNATWNGSSRSFPWEKFVTRFVMAFEELDRQKEAVPPSKQVTDFLNSITDVRLDAAKIMVRSNTAKYREDFEAVQQFFSSILLNDKSSKAVIEAKKRGLASLNAGYFPGRGGGGRNGGRGSKGQGGKGRGGGGTGGGKSDGPTNPGYNGALTGTYNAYDDDTWWNIMIEDQAQEVGRLRAAAKARKRKASALATDESKEKKLSPNSGTQFGRQGSTPKGDKG
jgi:hypothetical protein